MKRAGQLAWAGEGQRWLEPIAYRALIPGVFGTQPPHQRMPGVTVIPQAPAHLKCT